MPFLEHPRTRSQQTGSLRLKRWLLYGYFLSIVLDEPANAIKSRKAYPFKKVILIKPL